MKKYIVLLIAGMFSGLTMIAQNNHSPKAVVELNKLPVLYAGLDNPVQIAWSGKGNENLWVKADHGKLTKSSQGNYSIFIPFDSSGINVNISVYSKESNGHNKLLRTKKFMVKSIPLPIPAFGTKEEGEIDTVEIKQVNSITASLNDFVFEGINYLVNKFTFIYVPKQGPSIVIDSKIPTLTPEMKETLKSPKKGDKIIISDIWCSFPGSKDIKLPGAISLTVK